MAKTNDSMDFFLKVAAMRELQKQQYKLRLKKMKKELSADKADQLIGEVTERLKLVTKMVDDKIEFGLDFLTAELLEDYDLDDVVRQAIDKAVGLHNWKKERGYLGGGDNA